MPVPELPTVSEITANVRSSAGESVLSLDSGFSVVDFHPEYEYFDDQLISHSTALVPTLNLHASSCTYRTASSPYNQSANSVFSQIAMIS